MAISILISTYLLTPTKQVWKLLPGNVFPLMLLKMFDPNLGSWPLFNDSLMDMAYPSTESYRKAENLSPILKLAI